jgi:hypothetical protein
MSVTTIPSSKRFGRTIRRTRRWFRGLHDIIIPAGTLVEWIVDDTGGWAVLPKHVFLDSDIRELFSHDALAFYIWIDAIEVQPHSRQPRLTQPRSSSQPFERRPTPKARAKWSFESHG